MAETASFLMSSAFRFYGLGTLGVILPRIRRIAALKAVADSYRRRMIVIAGALGVLALFFSFSGPAFPGNTQMFPALAVLSAAALLLPLTILWQDRTPEEFSLAEKVKYRLDRLADSCSNYTSVFDDAIQRKKVGRKCRRQALHLITALRPYLPGEVETRARQVGTAPDLFTGDLNTFATMATSLLRRVAGALSRGEELPYPLPESLRFVVREMEFDLPALPESITSSFENTIESVKDVEPDTKLEASLGRRFIDWTRAGFAAHPLVGRVVVSVLILIAGAAVFLATLTVTGLMEVMTIEAIAGIYFAAMMLVFMIWTVLRLPST